MKGGSQDVNIAKMPLLLEYNASRSKFISNEIKNNAFQEMTVFVCNYDHYAVERHILNKLPYQYPRDSFIGIEEH